MRLFALFLEENARGWYTDLPEGGIKYWDQFHETFNKRWAIIKEGMRLLAKFQEAKKTKNGSVKDFTQRFDKLLKCLCHIDLDR